MHAMKEALKRMKFKSPSAKAPDSAKLVGGKEENEKLRGDNAPELHGLNQPQAGLDADGDQDISPDLLAKLIAQISHPGRDAMTLDEKAGENMKAKMASIMKHKQNKY